MCRNIYIHTYIHTYLLTPWIKFLLEKRTGPQLDKKFPVFYVTRRFIIPFTSARHLSLSCVCSNPSLHPYRTSWRSILLLSSSNLRLGLPSGLFLSCFPIKILHTPLLSAIRATCSTHLILLDFITRKIFVQQYRSFRSTDHSAPHYVVYCVYLLCREYWKDEMPMNWVQKNPVSTLITRKAFYVKYSGLGFRIHVRVSCCITAKKNIRLTTFVY